MPFDLLPQIPNSPDLGQMFMNSPVKKLANGKMGRQMDIPTGASSAPGGPAYSGPSIFHPGTGKIGATTYASAIDGAPLNDLRWGVPDGHNFGRSMTPDDPISRPVTSPGYYHTQSTSTTGREMAAEAGKYGIPTYADMYDKAHTPMADRTTPGWMPTSPGGYAGEGWVSPAAQLMHADIAAGEARDRATYNDPANTSISAAGAPGSAWEKPALQDGQYIEGRGGYLSGGIPTDSVPLYASAQRGDYIPQGVQDNSGLSSDYAAMSAQQAVASDRAANPPPMAQFSLPAGMVNVGGTAL